MAAIDKAFTSSIPELYERYLVPLIFAPYAQEVASRVKTLAPARVLETAAGTGVVTRAMAAVLPPTASLTVTDLNPAMLSVAQSTLAADIRITWKQADALALPFDDQSFDVVICQFGAMFFPDKQQGFSEAHRVLKPGGTFLLSVWDAIEDNVFAQVVTDALARLYPADPPRFLARTPHGYHDAAAIRRDLEGAGFADVDITTLEHVSRCASYRDAATAFCEGTPLRNELVARNAGGLEEATACAAEALRDRFGTGPISGKMQAKIITAMKARAS